MKNKYIYDTYTIYSQIFIYIYISIYVPIYIYLLYIYIYYIDIVCSIAFFSN